VNKYSGRQNSGDRWGNLPRSLVAALFAILVSFLVAPASAGALPFNTAREPLFPDNTDVRKALRRVVLAPSDEAIRVGSQVFVQNADGRHVKFEVRANATSFYLLFINEAAGRFPLFSQGSYIIKRNRKDGAFVQAKVFIQTNPDFFVRMFPAGDHTTMDLYLAGERVYSGVPVARAFPDVLFLPFSDVMEMTSGIVSWGALFPPEDLSLYEPVRKMVSTLRPALSTLPDAEDGAMDEEGRLVFIESLVLQKNQVGFNCSGFAKWVADSIYQPATGNYLTIDELKEKQLGTRGHRYSRRREDERDPYFGLDWSRNIATAFLRVEYPGADIGPEAADVRSVPFSRYVEDVGFKISELDRILYLLAVREPGNFYIGSVNKEFGSDPPLRQHVHVVVLFPFFKADGTFEVSVMERNVETSVKSLEDRYPGDDIHLVRVRAEDACVPPVIEYSR